MNNERLFSSLYDTTPFEDTFLQMSSTNIVSTSSFVYDAADSPLKNSQQLNVDWSKFENHVFFSSAEAKTGIAFEQIINKFPFDGSKVEYEMFFENINGYDKWIYDQFPKYTGYMHFSGSRTNENPAGGYSSQLGNWILVKDYKGALFPDLAKTESETSVLTPQDVSLSVEFFINPPYDTTSTKLGKMVVLQKLLDENNSFGVYYDTLTSSSDAGTISFSIVSSSIDLSCQVNINKNEWSHICAVWDRDSALSEARLYVNSKLQSTSAKKIINNLVAINQSNLLIGSGSTSIVNSSTYTPQLTLSGSIDELRIWHDVRTEKQIATYMNKSVFATDELKLYMKFNEPQDISADDSVSSIVLDYSGNSLHANIRNFSQSINRKQREQNEQMYNENEKLSPVLFPSYTGIVEINQTLMSEAKKYDLFNPNLITKLVPKHYLQSTDIFDNDFVDSYGGDGIPGKGELSSQQIIVSFLYVWARLFDELKLYIDSFGKLNFVDYEKNDNMPLNFLYDLSKRYGFFIPQLFNNSVIEQYINAENIDFDTLSENPLKDIQNEIFRRVMINIPDIIRSKGTLHSIEAFLRSVGIDPKNSVRIKEEGGYQEKSMSDDREFRVEQNFVFDTKNITTDDWFVYSPPLSGSRVEAGLPIPRGTFVNGISNDRSDGLYTTGSWSIESVYKLDSLHTTQSLFRLTSDPSTTPFNLFANAIAIRKDDSDDTDNNRIEFYLCGSGVASAPIVSIKLFLDDDDLFDGDFWNICISCEKNNDFETHRMKKYSIRAAKSKDGKIVKSYFTGSFAYEYYYYPYDDYYETLSYPLEPIVFEKFFDGVYPLNDALTYVPRIVLGPGKERDTSIYYLNDGSSAPSIVSSVDFYGSITYMRMWSKFISDDEFFEHTRNYRSAGSDNSLVNYNFSTVENSFEKLRLEVFTKQQELSTDSSSTLEFIDNSLNGMNFTLESAGSDNTILIPQTISYSYLSPYIDENVSNEKIRIRSYQNIVDNNIEKWSTVAPVYEIPLSEKPIDNNGLSIEISPIDALNKDIMTIFSTFKQLESSIGSPELLYSYDYPQLEKLRDIYFNRISGIVNFKSFFGFFRWFDQSMSRFIEQLIPKTTNYKGMNFVVSSHVLERNKFEYKRPTMYTATQASAATLYDRVLTGNVNKI
jgi:hypothetical protein